MTAIVGVLCTDGAVIGTDSSTTFSAGQMRTIEQPSEKLDVVEGRIIIAGTGQVGLGQRFRRVVDDAWKAKVFQGDPVGVGRELCKRAVEDFAYTQASKSQYGALVAFPVAQRPHLCEFATVDFQPELKATTRIWYCSMGSAQPITDPFLALIREVFWTGGCPTVQDATFAVVWTLDHAIAVNPGGVNGPARVAVLEPDGGKQLAARLLSDAELAEHRQAISQAKERLQGVKQDFSPGAEQTPDVPKPER